MKKGVKKEDYEQHFYQHNEEFLYPKSFIEGSLSEKDKTNIEKIYKKLKKMTSQGK